MQTIILTAKNDQRIEFYASGSHTPLAKLDMPAPVHELALSADGGTAYGSVFGGGVFGKNKDPDHRVVVIDLKAHAIDGYIDTGAHLAPHGLMFGADGMLWVTAELNNAILGIDTRSRKVVKTIDITGAAHWLAVSADGTRAYVSHKQTHRLGIVDLLTGRVVNELHIPNRCEGLALTHDGATLYLASHVAPEVNVIDARNGRLIKSVRIEGAPEDKTQLRRVRISPDQRWLLFSSHQDGQVAVFKLPSLEQSALIKVGKAPMGLGFSDTPDQALVCNHDDGVVSQLDLQAGLVTQSFGTGRGCEYVQYF